VHHIPLIFKEGGRVCILPNDKNGRVWDMYKAALKKGGTTVCAFLSPGPARNPLDCNSANPFIICYDAKWFNDKHSVENWIDDFARIPQYSKHH
jgi:predicted oxidoreductase (fatty acid repression mutant protein)